MCDKWYNAPKFGPKYGTDPRILKSLEGLSPQELTPTGRFLNTQPEMQELRPRSGKFDRGSTAPVNTTQYTGTKMLGVGQLHKSNAVPVFSQEEATDLARMRRN